MKTLLLRREFTVSDKIGPRSEPILEAWSISILMRPVNVRPQLIYVAFGAMDTGQNPTPPLHMVLLYLSAAVNLHNAGLLEIAHVTE
jgi:hypothetical protein